MIVQISKSHNINQGDDIESVPPPVSIYNNTNIRVFFSFLPFGEFGCLFVVDSLIHNPEECRRAVVS